MPLQIESTTEIEAPASPNASQPDSEPRFDISHLLDVPMRTEVILGTFKMKVASISTLRVGTVLRTLRLAGEPLDLMVNSTLVAAAEICPQGQKLGLRVVAFRTAE